MKLLFHPYIIALWTSALAFFARWLMDPYLGSTVPFVTFFISTTICVWFGNNKSGLIAITLGFLGSLYFAHADGLTTLAIILSSICYFIMVGIKLTFAHQMRKATVKIAKQKDEIAKQKDNLENVVKKRTTELQETVDELTRSNEELGKFAYVASHDLKAPLRAVTNLVSWISEDVKEGKDVAKYVATLNGRVKRMEALINGLLEYSRVGRMHTETELIDINEIIKKLQEDYPETAQKIIIESKLPVINFNTVRIGQVFSNLIGNAFKHHHDVQNAIVKVSCKEVGDDWVFCIEDNGPGIDAQYWDKIFEIFQTLKPRDEVESTGIGLAIVKKIIEDCDGRIWIESYIDEGSKFYFSIHK